MEFEAFGVPGRFEIVMSSFAFRIVRIEFGGSIEYFSGQRWTLITRLGRLRVDESIDADFAGPLPIDLSRGTVRAITRVLGDVPTIRFRDQVIYVWREGSVVRGCRSGDMRPREFLDLAEAVHELSNDAPSPSAEREPSGSRVRSSAGERLLLRIVRELYPDAQSQAHLPFMGAMHLDVYIPSMRVGLEYQGAYHSEPIRGEAILAAQQERDARKRRLCKENGVQLIEVHPGFDVPSLLQQLAVIAEDVAH